MVDSLKNLTSLPNSAVSGPQKDSLRKNLKSLSSVSVSRGDDSDSVPSKGSPADHAASAVVHLTDAVQLSADALRSLGNAHGDTDAQANPDIVQENIAAASVSPEDLQKVQEQAESTGAAIQFNRDEALHAHGRGLNPETVYRLLAD